MRASAAVLAICVLASLASAQTISASLLTISPAWTRATPPGATAAVGYLAVVNNGNNPDELVGIEFAEATGARLHQTIVADGISSMRMVEEMVIAPGQTIDFEPGSFHIMFTGLKRPLRTGEMVPGALIFKEAGRVPLEFRVEPIGATEPTAE